MLRHGAERPLSSTIQSDEPNDSVGESDAPAACAEGASSDCQGHGDCFAHDLAHGSSCAEDGEPGGSAMGCPPEEREPCPPPLDWQQVLEAFLAGSRSWELPRGSGVVRGRTWGAGPAVYFLNGFGGSFRLYALAVWLLRENFRCVVYDYRTTDREASLLTLDDHVADLFAVADEHGDEAFQLYATSFGVMVGLQAALSSPTRIERAVLQTGMAHLKLTWFERMMLSAGRHLPGRVRRIPFYRRIQQESHRALFPPFDTTRWGFYEKDSGDVELRELAGRVAALRGYDLSARLGDVRQPVCLIRTEGEGRLAQQRQEALAGGLADCHQEFLHSCGYVPFLTHPHRLTKLIKPFLSGAELSSAEEETVTTESGVNH